MPILTGWPTDAGDGSVSTEERWRKMAQLWAPSGVVDGYLGELAPSYSAGNVTVQSGAAWMDGHYAEQLTSSSVAVTANGLVVIRFTPADDTFELLYRDGATSLTQTDATWELGIARMTGSAMTDLRHLLPLGGSFTRRIASVVLASTTATIDFPELPPDLNNLRLVASLRGTTTDDQVIVRLRLNGNSSALYSTQRSRSTGSTITAVETIDETGFRFNMPAIEAQAQHYAAVAVDLPAYRSTTIRQQILFSNGWTPAAGSVTSGDMFIDHGFGSWQVNAAVTRLTLIPEFASFAAGSTATLYGSL